MNVVTTTRNRKLKPSKAAEAVYDYPKHTEPIWRLAASLGVLVLPATDWDGGAWYLSTPRPGILIPEVPLRLERWYIGHELGHHMDIIRIGNPAWLAEARADKWAVKTLLGLYDIDQVEWPDRVLNKLSWLRTEVQHASR